MPRARNECGGLAGILAPSLDLRKPEDGLSRDILCFVQIRVNLAHPSFTPEQVATGLSAQEPPAGLIELFDTSGESTWYRRTFCNVSCSAWLKLWMRARAVLLSL